MAHIHAIGSYGAGRSALATTLAPAYARARQTANVAVVPLAPLKMNVLFSGVYLQAEDGRVGSESAARNGRRRERRA